MIRFEKFELSNGLKVIVHNDKSTNIVAFNILYNIGAKDENPEKTGFAHLFEHLMFGGSINIPSYDTPLQIAGGENNAFTNNDYTNYYITLPKTNLETAFWLESDRMLCLDFSEKNLNVQRQVVIEEFKQRYLNQPYGDVWLLLRPLAYKKHPYQWATIGKDISHIEKATLDDVKQFFYSHYAPNNAIMCIAGNVTVEEIKQLAEKWFGPIEARNIEKRNLPKEPKQRKPRTLTVKRNVPYNSIYKAYHICNRKKREYYATDLISDILAQGGSSRLYQNLVKQKKLFGEIDAYITAELDGGLFIIFGNLLNGVDMTTAENAIQQEIDTLISYGPFEHELEKVKNKIEASLIFEEMNVLNKATNLCYYELLGNASLINREVKKYRNVSKEEIITTAKKIFAPTNCNTLYYYSNEN